MERTNKAVCHERRVGQSLKNWTLLSQNHQLFVPEHAVEETRRRFGLIMKKTGLSEDEVELVLGVLLTNLHVIPSKDIMANWKGGRRNHGWYRWERHSIRSGCPQPTM